MIILHCPVDDDNNDDNDNDNDNDDYTFTSLPRVAASDPGQALASGWAPFGGSSPSSPSPPTPPTWAPSSPSPGWSRTSIALSTSRNRTG